jgi:uroporphyrinogen-III synthase
MLEEAGYTAFRLATIEIREPEQMASLQSLVDSLQDYDLAVFISVNAVSRGLDYILARRGWPQQVKIAPV